MKISISVSGGTASSSSETSGLADLDDQRLNVLVEREVLNSDHKTTAGHVELLVNGFHPLSQDVNLLDGEWFEKVLQEVHLVVKWFHLQVS